MTLALRTYLALSHALAPVWRRGLQGRLKRGKETPRSVRQNGLFVEAADSGFLMLVGLRSPDGSVSEAALGDFMARNIIEELRRIDGVGRHVGFITFSTTSVRPRRVSSSESGTDVG